MRSLIISLILTFCISISNAQTIPSAEIQIEQATMPIPEGDRSKAKVYGYSSSGEFVTLREGSNNYICLSNDPTKNGFSVACYHKDLDAFMARGRELKKAGKSFKETFDIRENEVKSGQLSMPDKSTLTVMSGELDDSGNPTNTSLRYVIYIPYATSASTGLPEAPQTAGGAWIMNPGTHRAHIMVTPPSKN